MSAMYVDEEDGCLTGCLTREEGWIFQNSCEQDDRWGTETKQFIAFPNILFK